MAIEAERVIGEIVERLAEIEGVEAIVLGGSRATGTHIARSDIDIGLYYRAERPMNLEMLGRAAAELDDERRSSLLTSFGGWGPWINGGGWLRVGGIAVDFLYRELGQVEGVLAACHAGKIEFAYQPGHPHGFASPIYMGEVAYCQPLWDPRGTVAALKAQTVPYPRALSEAIIRRFFWEADFSMTIARKGAVRGDAGYVAGCCFRCLACLLQTLFARNERYLLNEKGAVAIAAGFTNVPRDFQARVEAGFGMLRGPEGLADAVQVFEGLITETGALLEGAR
jgi:predicted nucleotidyltransferase